MQQATTARLLAETAHAAADLTAEAQREVAILRARLAHAERLLKAVGASRRNRRGYLHLTCELERAVEAYCTQTPWVAYYARRGQSIHAELES